MKPVKIKIANQMIDILLPESAKVFSMTTPTIIADPARAVEQALTESIGSPNLEEIVVRKLRSNRDCKVVIVISDIQGQFLIKEMPVYFGLS